jgi:hypothetical protein
MLRCNITLMEGTMRYPMILPWLARKSGVAVRDAERLWNEVLHRRATLHTDEIRGSGYWGAVLREFRQKLEKGGLPVSSPVQTRNSAPFEPNLLSTFWHPMQIAQQSWVVWAGTLIGLWVNWPRLAIVRVRCA